MKLYKIENLCDGEWIARSIWARDFRYLLELLKEKDEDVRNRLRVKRVRLKEEAVDLINIENMAATEINFDEIEWVS